MFCPADANCMSEAIGQNFSDYGNQYLEISSCPMSVISLYFIDFKT